jgi:hypothetical protein
VSIFEAVRASRWPYFQRFFINVKTRWLMTKKLPATPETAYLDEDVHRMLEEMAAGYVLSKSKVVCRALRLQYEMMQLENKQKAELLALFQGNISLNDRRKDRRR